MGKEGIPVYIINRKQLKEGFLVPDPNSDDSLSRGGRRKKLIEGICVLDKKGQPIEELNGVPTIDIKDWGKFVKTLTED
ncbi:MAG: hypothetical protein Q7R77_03070 [Candidatus Daviesbacteria bacterium]|nr:hypothetical protein [Candidatus Daviesbacteria bacterium]